MRANGTNHGVHNLNFRCNPILGQSQFGAVKTQKLVSLSAQAN